ncbi:hypothetical protein DFS34DRAFT_230654 [Phlyctochytrium arcticum]|nr:hypothetical protein DFS34DRAFT_230654 [Phlyctochytrium arcticum]
MKFTTTFLAAVIAVAAIASPAFADPVFNDEPEFKLGEHYDIWIDYGIVGPVPQHKLYIGYVPDLGENAKPSETQAKWTEVGEATHTIGSATRFGVKWVAGYKNKPAGDPVANQADLVKSDAKWRWAARGEAKGADGLYSYWVVSLDLFQVIPRTGKEIISVSPLPGTSIVVTATPTMTMTAIATATQTPATPGVNSGALPTSDNVAGAVLGMAAAGGAALLALQL